MATCDVQWEHVQYRTVTKDYNTKEKYSLSILIMVYLIRVFLDCHKQKPGCIDYLLLILILQRLTTSRRSDVHNMMSIVVVLGPSLNPDSSANIKSWIHQISEG